MKAYQLVMFIDGFRENQTKVEGKIFIDFEEAKKQAEKLNDAARLNGFQIEYLVKSI